MSSLRKKLEALEAALGSPSDTAAGLARRLIQESPAPSALFRTPKPSAGAGDSLSSSSVFKTPKLSTHDIDLDASPELFATPNPVDRPKKRLRVEERKRTVTDSTFCVSKPTRLVTANMLTARHVGTASDKLPHAHRSHDGKPRVGVSTAVSATLQNISNKPSVGGLLGNRKEFAFSLNVSQSSVFREGYNGLGGHDKVVIPPVRSKHSVVLKRPVVCGQMKRFLGPSKTTRTPPPLPSLETSEEF